MLCALGRFILKILHAYLLVVNISVSALRNAMATVNKRKVIY